MAIKDPRPFTAVMSEKIEVLLPYISASDVLIAGSETLVAGLRYEEENMFAPIIILMEQGVSIDEFKEAASNYGVPFMENEALIKNLFFYGRLGEAIPELCCRDIAAILARTGKKPNTPVTPVKTSKKPQAKLPRPVRLEMGRTLTVFLRDEAVLEEGLDRIRKRLSRLMGYSLPPIGITENIRLKDGEYRILFKGIEAGRGSLDLGWYKTIDLGLGFDEIRLAAKAAATLLVSWVDELVQNRSPELLGRDEVQAILDRAEKKYPVVTGEVKSFLSLGSIRDILRGLLSEQVSIRHIQVILETLADWGSFGPAPNEIIIEQIRQSLKRQICLEYTDEKQTLRVLTLEAKLEQKFSDKAMFCDNAIPGSGMSPEDWLEVFSPAVRGMEERGLKPVILCAPGARSFVKEFTRIRFPHLAVLSYIEIPSDIIVESVGEIAFKEVQKNQRSGRRLNS